MSDCRTTITVNNTVQGKSDCTVRYQNRTIEHFGCPFSQLDSAPGMIWTCGGMAYYHLDEGDWRGCCYPALLSTGTTVLVKRGSETIMGNAAQQSREKRDVNSMPNRYNGYKTVDPWTTLGENIGWSLAGFFTEVGTTVALNKINGLAWQVLSLENDTAHALGLITDELKKMKEAVIQNRLVLVDL
ncbi:Endogenous retrovirus group 3 member 1 Env polyprotein [Labeo rohita]|uniref:Endogenous retrovirus group 3 member 1 Env polyprotein n=1 Tax=Labeo rohita TaxID=84645 RepID=A0ABQ8L870_LABRO|nr:Endogenous retrovirus group 3 member 1 Env polyprotein [Labeo rohita]